MTIYCKYFTLIKHLLKNTFDFLQDAQTIEFLPDINAFTNKSQGLIHVKLHL